MSDKVIDLRWECVKRNAKRLRKDRSQQGLVNYFGYALSMSARYPEHRDFLLNGKEAT